MNIPNLRAAEDFIDATIPTLGDMLNEDFIDLVRRANKVRDMRTSREWSEAVRLELDLRLLWQNGRPIG